MKNVLKCAIVFYMINEGGWDKCTGRHGWIQFGKARLSSVAILFQEECRRCTGSEFNYVI